MDALKYPKAPLALMISTLMWTPMTDASDIEIYKQAQQGQTTLVLMLDTSGSMGVNEWADSVKDDYGFACYDDEETETVTEKGSSIFYERVYCWKDGVKYYDRLSRLKDALFALMNDATIQDAYIGLGNFSAKGGGKYGQILVAAKQLGPLGSAQRLAIKQAAAGLSATGNTPTAPAYAEAAAYLMGTSTGNGSPIYNVVQRKLTNGKYQNCTANSSSVSSIGSYKIFTCSSGAWPAAAQNPSLTLLYRDKSSYEYYGQPSGKFSYDAGGMGYAEGKTDIIQNGEYVSPLPANNKTCSGQGIYFLTDGEPNSGVSITDQTQLMTTANLPQSFSCSGANRLTGGALSNPNWECIGQFARTLNSTNNAYGAAIKTAVVGFGKALAGVPKNADGTWGCAGSSKADPKNACLWGNKGSGYGEGGFYLGSSPQDVVDSIKKFVADLTVAIPSTSTGSIVIPQDQLNSSALQPFGYLSALDPQPGTSLLIWQGNVKRYQISEGTVKDTAGNLVFSSTGGFNDTTDYWNTSGQSDQGTTVNGGMYSQIPVPTTTSPSTSRPLYINRVDSAGTLLTTVNLSALQVGGVLATWNDNRRIRLANALGYGADADTALLAKLNDSSKPVPTLTGVPYRVLGGIVHATPQLLTYQGSGDPDPTKIDPNRQDYVMAGSMDGVLHIVDAKTGVEAMSFLPKELLDLQAEALKQDATGTALVYGVDAPWAVDTTYELDRSGQLFKAKTMNIYGGLRMGSGDTSLTTTEAKAARSYYGLDVINLSNPKLLFRIGADQTGFDRMGQTWAKPTLTEIRYKGKRTKVMIVPGGYDTQFENPEFNPGINTLGNAVYIVDASNGTLLWSTSASAGASLNNTYLKYSITGRVSTLDRDADGLADHLYFADLGGQVFRVDVDNDNQVSTTSTAPLAKRVVRLADLGDSKTGIEKPRFYEAPTVTVHDVGAERFILVNVASGDRSSPLDVIPTTRGGQGKTRLADNAVYGIIDRDVARTDLYTMDDTILQTKDLKLRRLLESPKSKGKTQGDMLGAARADRGEGWYYNLNDTATGSVTGALKGYGEMIAINGDLYVNVYNPQVQATNNDCSAQVVGETVVRRYCLPFGLDNGTSCTVPNEGYYGFKLGKGMLEASLGPTVSGGKINAETRQLIFQDPNRKQDDKGTPGQLRQFSTPKGLVSTRWFERQPKVSRPSK